MTGPTPPELDLIHHAEMAEATYDAVLSEMIDDYVKWSAADGADVALMRLTTRLSVHPHTRVCVLAAFMVKRAARTEHGVTLSIWGSE